MNGGPVRRCAFRVPVRRRLDDIAGVDLSGEVNAAGSPSADLVIRLADTTFASMAGTDFIL